MRNTLYRQMVYWINAHRTWIEVADDNLYKEHIISRSDRTDYLVSRTLVLRAFKTNGTHLEGTTWAIPEHELNKALAIYRKQDRSFNQRIKKAAMNLTPKPLSAWQLMILSTWNSEQHLYTYPKNHITYVTENIATHLLRDPSCTVIDIVQKAIPVYGKVSRFHETKHQSPQTLYTGDSVPATAFPLCLCKWTCW